MKIEFKLRPGLFGGNYKVLSLYIDGNYKFGVVNIYPGKKFKCVLAPFIVGFHDSFDEALEAGKKYLLKREGLEDGEGN